MPSRKPKGNENPTPPQNNGGGDAWEQLEKIANSGGKSNQNYRRKFFLKKGEQAKIVLLDSEPLIWSMHTVTRSINGKRIFEEVRCQKDHQDHCTFCDNAYEGSPIGKSSKRIIFRIVDERGIWDSDANNGQGGFTFNPTFKVFITPNYLAMDFNNKRHSTGGDLSKYIIQLNKLQKYSAELVTEDAGGGNFRYAESPDFDDTAIEVINIEDVLPTYDNDAALALVNRVLAAPAAPTNTGFTGNTGGGQQGGFGGGNSSQQGGFGSSGGFGNGGGGLFKRNV
jgi:uncharacterized membrane protein YgcG